MPATKNSALISGSHEVRAGTLVAGFAGVKQIAHFGPKTLIDHKILCLAATFDVLDSTLSVVSGMPAQLQVITESEDATTAFGRQLAAVLQPGCVIALVGDLGAGKTRLVQSIATGLGVPVEQVNSPTFTLVHEYPGHIPIRHCDTYRLRNPEEFLDLGLDELFAPDGIALVEWADRVMHLLPRDVLKIEIRILSPTSREFLLTATGKSSTSLLDRLRAITCASQ